jgi:hypothetical protein
MNKWYGIPLLLVAIVGICAMAGIGPAGITSDSLHYNNIVCVSAVQGGVYHDYGCTHNMFTTRGKWLLGWLIADNGTTGQITKIGISNVSATNMQLSDTDLYGLYGAGCGLGIATDLPVSIAAGNWSINNTWTDSGCTTVVNATGVYPSSSSGNLIAEANFTSVTLNNGDQLTVTYNQSVS